MVDELERLYRARLNEFVRAAGAIAGDREAGRDAVQEASRDTRRRARFAALGAADRPAAGDPLPALATGTVGATLSAARATLRRALGTKEVAL
jgi:hypothetical protein